MIAKLKFRFFTLLLVMGFTISVSNAQNVIVSGAVVGNGPYADLGSAFAAINGGSQTGATILIGIVGNTVEPVTAVLNQGTWTYLSIMPVGGVARIISGNIAGQLIDFDGADRVLIDGLNSGGNSLTISNSNNTFASTIRYLNDAKTILVQNCTILGANVSITSGTVFISAGDGINGGNDTIAFNACTISNDPAGNPVNGIYAAGSLTPGQENNGVNFLNCNIANFFNAASVSNGVLVGSGNAGWTINGCRFYQTSTNTYTTANTHAAIKINSGDGNVITNNTIGFASSSATGVYTMTSTVATRFIGIDLNVGTSLAASVQGNTITAIALATSSGATTANGVLCGIRIAGGNVNIGNLAPNIIGGILGTNLITAVPTTSAGAVVGINSATTGTIVIQNNIIGGLYSSGVTPAVAGGVAGINVSATASSLNISGNTIGNSTSNNMQAGTATTTGSSIASGINLPSTPLASVITNNTIQNFISYGTGTGGYIRGIWTAAATGNTSNYLINGNTINNLTSNNANTTIANGACSAVGINLSVGTNGVVSNNIISNIANTNTAATARFVAGITHGNASNSTIINNRIYDLRNESTSIGATAPGVAAGVIIRSGTNYVKVINNMISLGTGQATNTAFIGIMANHGSAPNPIDSIFFNTTNITGIAAVGAQPSFGFLRGDFSVTARTITVAIANNLITNDRSGGTGFHFAIGNNYGATVSSTGWAANASNYNVLNANPSTVGWWGANLNFAGWKTASLSDNQSYSGIAVTYVNAANDLHLNMGVTPTFIESGGIMVTGISTDIDADVRPGPSGSVNGGGVMPDIGADEFDGVGIDIMGPIFTYVPFTYTCQTGDRVVSVNISDYTGVPTSGILRPRIYYKKNSGPYASTPGTLTSGTDKNGSWNFSILAADIGGLSINDTVYYFLIAQDVVAIPNISSSPSAGLVATDVNNITTTPTNPNWYLISPTLSGTYTVGTGGDFATLTNAVIAYNSSCLVGSVLFSLTDASYPSEVFPISINQNPDASPVNTLTIKPANGISPVISGNNAVTIIRLNGADYITIDGCNNPGDSSRDLSISNSNASTTSAAIWLNSLNVTNGAMYNVIKNCIVAGNTPTTTMGAVVSSGTGMGAVAETANTGNSYINNELIRARYGLALVGPLGNETGTVVSNNRVGSVNAGDKIGFQGISIFQQNDVLVSDNLISGISSTSTTSPNCAGIAVLGTQSGGSIVRNTIYDIKNTNAGGWGAYGIVLSSSSTGINMSVANNFISDVAGYGWTGIAINDNGYGIAINAGTGYNIWYNSVLLNTDQTTGTYQTAALWISSVVAAPGSLDIRNNLFINSQTTGTQRYSIFYGGSDPNVFTSIDYNDYSTSGPNLGFIGGVNYVDLAGIQTGFGGNTSSLNVLPVFSGAPDLHLVTFSNPAINSAATPIVSVTGDIDEDLRDPAVPDMGADEFIQPCLGSVGGTAVLNGQTEFCESASVMIDASGFSTGPQSGYQWEYSNDNFSVDINDLLGQTIPDSMNSGIISSTTYFRLKVTCPYGPSTSYSNTITVTINPLPTVVITSTGILCNGDMAIVNVTGTGGTVPYTGELTDTLGSGTYTYQISDVNGCNSVPDSIVLIDPPLLEAFASATGILCNGDLATVTVSASGGTGSYSGTGTFFESAGSYNYIVTDSNGCSAQTDTVILLDPPLLEAFANATTILCYGDTSAVTVTASGGAGNYSGTGTFYEVAGFYNYIVTDSNGCTATIDILVSQPDELAIDVVASQIMCNGDLSTIDVSATGGTLPYSGTGIFYEGAGSYFYTVTDSNGCTSSSSISLTEPAPVDISVVQSGDSLTAQSFLATSYQWMDCNADTIIPGATGQLFIPSASGDYAVIVTEGFCTDTSLCYYVLVTGVHESLMNPWIVEVVPNPSNGVFRVTSSEQGDFRIVNEVGQIVYSFYLNKENNYTADIDFLSSGVYFVIGNSANSISRQKIIVSR